MTAISTIRLLNVKNGSKQSKSDLWFGKTNVTPYRRPPARPERARKGRHSGSCRHAGLERERHLFTSPVHRRMDDDRLAFAVRRIVSLDTELLPRRRIVEKAVGLDLPSLGDRDDRLPDLLSGLLHRRALHHERRQCRRHLCDGSLHRRTPRLGPPQGAGRQPHDDCRRRLPSRRHHHRCLVNRRRNRSSKARTTTSSAWLQEPEG